MFSRFFIDRPIFALVISIIIVLTGLLALKTIPVAQFPSITPPVVQVTATFPGANAEVLEATVTNPLEEELNSVDNLLYISSKSSNSGQAILTMTFAVGTDPDMAQVNVQTAMEKEETYSASVGPAKALDIVLIVEDEVFALNAEVLENHYIVLTAKALGYVVAKFSNLVAGVVMASHHRHNHRSKA